jgi:predicted RecA/RadA family phage recombinase
MSTSFREPGDVLEFTAPAGDVESGVPVLIGNLIVIPLDDAAEGEKFRAATSGVHSVPKTDEEAWDEGELVFLDAAAGEFTTVDAGNYPAGVAVEAVTDDPGNTTGKVRLNGCGVVAVAGP